MRTREPQHSLLTIRDQRKESAKKAESWPCSSGGSPDRQQGGRKSRCSWGKCSHRYARIRSSDGHCAAGACSPALLAFCARSGGQCACLPVMLFHAKGIACALSPQTAVNAHRLRRSSAPIFLAWRPLYLLCSLSAAHTLAAAAQAAAADLISDTRGRTCACCAVTADSTTSEMRSNRRNMAAR